MVPDLFFSQLVLVALVWLYFMLHWVWPSDSAAVPDDTRAPLPTATAQASLSPHPLWAILTSPIVMPVSKLVPTLIYRAPSAPPPQIVLTRGRRRRVDTHDAISARTRICRDLRVGRLG